MRSDAIFPNRFTKVDDLTRPHHWYLTEDDACYFLGEYTARQGFAYSSTNNLIVNFKKPVDRRGRAEWRYKERAIGTAASALRGALNQEGLDQLTFVPVPPSKAKDHPLYDDRLTRMLHAIRRDPPLDVRELVVQTESTDAVHDSDIRPRPEEIEARYAIDETITESTPSVLGRDRRPPDNGCALPRDEVDSIRSFSGIARGRAVHRTAGAQHRRPH